jgi:hypothetical protein
MAANSGGSAAPDPSSRLLTHFNFFWGVRPGCGGSTCGSVACFQVYQQRSSVKMSTEKDVDSVRAPATFIGNKFVKVRICI